jgi:hypothetical protein
MGKNGPVPSASTLANKVRLPGARVAAKNRGPRGQVFVAGVENRPYFVVVLELGITKPGGLRLVSTPRTKTCPRGPRSERFFARNAIRLR